MYSNEQGGQAPFNPFRKQNLPPKSLVSHVPLFWIETIKKNGLYEDRTRDFGVASIE